MTIQWLGTPARFGHLGQQATPAICWSDQRFLDCHGRAFQRAQAECTAAFIPEMTLADIEACIRAVHKRISDEECVTQFCPPEVVTPGVSFPWKQYSRATEALQRQTNEIIRQRRAEQGGFGFCEISVDGYLGPITCRTVADVNPGALPGTCTQRSSEWEGRARAFCGPQGPVDCPPDMVKSDTGCEMSVPPHPPVCPSGEEKDPITGECIPAQCPLGQQLVFDADTREWMCVPVEFPPAVAARGGGTGGLVLLTAAALGALFLATQVA